MNLKLGIALLGASTLCACASMAPVTQEQSATKQFAAGAHAVDSAEIAFLRQVQNSECISDFYSAAFAFATADKDPRTHQYVASPLDLLPVCQPKELTAAQLQTRQSLMDALAAYGDAMQTLMNGNSDQTLDTDGETMAKAIQGVAKQEGFTSIGGNEVAGLNAAVIAVTQWVIDRHEYDNVKDAAAKVEPSLEIIVNALKAANTNDAAGIQVKLNGVKNEFQIAMLAARAHRGAASFMDVANAHALLSSLAVPSDVTQLNKALDALVTSNKAMASGDKASAVQEISNLVSEGQKAVAVYNASK
ncbi:MAG TPA: hypothetical protein VME63_00640 [Dyella sp.]|uniref:hypothetical protein n=1 Tax=Dyella sp. TaxID=1869338 RepID=UPI002BE23284|nr:hypothetical protein [Dyella sp.]HTV83883.1 hypothetical protein [Dyella sp.]